MTKLWDVFLTFLYLGLTAYGGLAMVEPIRQRVVQEKGWLAKRSFWMGAVMRKLGTHVLPIAALCLVLSITACEQGHREPQKGGRQEPAGQYSRMFDPKSLETFTGEVTTVDQLTPGYGMSDRVWLGLKTDKGMILVILGPTWFHKKKRISRSSPRTN